MSYIDPPLRAAALMDEAAKRSDLSDYGDTYFVAGLEVLCSAMEEEARLSERGRVMRVEEIVMALENRLRAEDTFKKFPEILEQDIKVDAVIGGLPRTGSTMLHRLLSSDPANTAMRMWEGVNPSPFAGETRGDPSARIAVAEAGIEFSRKANPDFQAIHVSTAQDAEEEILILKHTFVSSVAESSMYVPSYGEWVKAQDHTQAYGDLKRFLKFLQWQEPGREKKRWVLKTPQHVPLVDVVLKTFPDAKFIMTHRDPVQTVPSFASMIAAYSGQATDMNDLHAIGRYWHQRLKWNLEQFLEKRAKLDADAFIDVDYLDTLKDPMGTAALIYERLGRPITHAAEADMINWVEENEQNKHGKHDYSAAQFGLDEDELARDFAAYRERFVL